MAFLREVDGGRTVLSDFPDPERLRAARMTFPEGSPLTKAADELLKLHDRGYRIVAKKTCEHGCMSGHQIFATNSWCNGGEELELM